MLDACVNAPTPEFCLEHPTDIACPTYPPTPEFCLAHPEYPTCPKTPPVCTLPKILDPITNTCETPSKTCVAPKEYSYLLNACVNAPTPEFCLAHPTDATCPTPEICLALPNFPGCPLVDPTKNPPIVTVTATPSSIKSGETSTISWTSTNTTSTAPCNAGTGNGTGASGSFKTGALTKSMSYTVSCTGANGKSSGNAFVIVDTSGLNTCKNTANNPPLCTTLNGTCINGAKNPDICTDFSQTVPPVNPNDSKIKISACKIIDANPLTYTTEEQRELDELLRKFYLLASTLKTQGDLTLAYREIEEYKALVSQVKNITTQCYNQIDGPEVNGIRPNKSAYRDAGGVTAQFGNPWFKYTDRGSYLPSTTEIISSCKYCEPNDTGSSYYCSGDMASSKIPFCEPNGKETRALGNNSRYYNAFGVPAFSVLGTVSPTTAYNVWTTGFKLASLYVNPMLGILSWTKNAPTANPGPTIRKANLKDFEKILNIW